MLKEQQMIVDRGVTALAARCLLFVGALLVGAPVAEAGEKWDPWKGRVVEVLSGDTIIVQHLKAKSWLEVRVAGIDCPELGQPGGLQARQLTAKLARGKVVIVDPVAPRSIARVRVGDKDLAEQLLRAGLAWYRKKHRLEALTASILAKLETAARQAKRGLWATKRPISPWQWVRKRRSCRKDADCVAIAPFPSCGCGPCTRRPLQNQAINKKHLPRPTVCSRPRCAPCPGGTKRRTPKGKRVWCLGGQCSIRGR